MREGCPSQLAPQQTQNICMYTFVQCCTKMLYKCFVFAGSVCDPHLWSPFRAKLGPFTVPFSANLEPFHTLLEAVQIFHPLLPQIVS